MSEKNDDLRWQIHPNAIFRLGEELITDEAFPSEALSRLPLRLRLDLSHEVAARNLHLDRDRPVPLRGVGVDCEEVDTTAHVRARPISHLCECGPLWRGVSDRQ